MFKTRLISGILLVAVALLTIMSGSYILFFTLLGISLIGMQELYKAMQVHKEKFTLLEITGYVGAVVYYIAMAADYEKYGMMGLILALILLLFVYVFTYPRFHAGEVMEAFFGIVYVPATSSFSYPSASTCTVYSAYGCFSWSALILYSKGGDFNSSTGV